MARPKSWGDERTDPGVPGPTSDSTVVGPSPVPVEDTDAGSARSSSGRDKVHLGAPGSQPPSADKTRVSSLDEIESAEPAESAEKTVMVHNPLISDEEPANGADPKVDATVVTSNPLAAGRKKPARTVGRLRVTEGKEKGRVIELVEGAKVLGRSKECDFTLLDIQISRKHIELNVDHNGVRLVDLGSGNGTFVNDEQIESVNLVHGDEIAVGDHLLLFEEEGPVASALPALVKRGPVGVAARQGPVATGGPPSSAEDVLRRARQRRAQGDGGAGKKRRMMLVGGALVVLAFAGIALGLRPDPEPPAPAGPSLDEQAQQVFNAGVQRFRDANYEEALQRFEAVVENMPEHREAGRYLTAARREISARDQISRGNALLAQQEYDQAREAFRSVDSESLRHQEAQNALRRVDEEHARSIVLEGEALLEEDELDDAAAVFARALEVIPGYASAERGIERVEEQRAALQRMTRAQRQRQARLARQRRQRAQRQATAAVRRALAAGERQFNEGDFQKAIDTFTDLSQSNNAALARQARQKSDAVRSFRPAYERGMSAAESRAAEQAINDLTVAERHARAVSRNGQMHREIRERLADMHHLQGRIAYNAQRFQVAYRHWSSALSMSPQHRYAGQGMDDLRKKGEEVYLEAYMTRTLNRENAIRLFRQVIAMTPPDFEYHQRSKQRLAELER